MDKTSWTCRGWNFTSRTRETLWILNTCILLEYTIHIIYICSTLQHTHNWLWVRRARRIKEYYSLHTHTWAPDVLMGKGGGGAQRGYLTPSPLFTLLHPIRWAKIRWVGWEYSVSTERTPPAFTHSKAVSNKKNRL